MAIQFRTDSSANRAVDFSDFGSKPREALGAFSKEEIEIHFRDFFFRHGYQIAPSIGILAKNDPTILYINSSIAPFKERILKSERISPSAISQPCFRDRESEDYLYNFQMLGLVADKEYLDSSTRHFREYLFSLGFSEQDLFIVLHKEDRELVQSMSDVFGREQIRFVEDSNPKYKVRWVFGQEALSGKGLTIAARISTASPCPDIMDRSYVPLGNIIIVRNKESEREYLDFGFGLECIQSVFFDGKIFDIPFYANQIAALTEFCRHPKYLLKDLMACEALLSSGVEVSPKGAGFLLKKLQKQVYTLLSADQAAELDHFSDRDSVFYSILKATQPFWPSSRLPQWAKTFDFLSNGFSEFLRLEQKNRTAAALFMKSKKGERLSAQDMRKKLMETYGLTEASVNYLMNPILTQTRGMSMTVSTTRSAIATGNPADITPIAKPNAGFQVEVINITGPVIPVQFRKGVIAADSVRKQFLKYFADNDHLTIKGASIIPQNDPTLLFVNSGMAPLKDFFLGLAKPPSPRFSNIQTCIRTNDIDDIGDRHHLSLFHMLGSWSIGDYYKDKAVQLAYELLINVFRFPKDKIYATVFGGDKELGLESDEESVAAWKAVGMPDDHIVRLPKEDNLWGPAGEVGPCGPCTEVFFDTGDTYAPPYIPGRGETFDTKRRYIEIWNAGVFMQFYKEQNGSFTPLKMKSVDTGSGLERMTMTLNGYESVYDTDLLKPILESCQEFFKGKKVSEKTMRMMTDHIRTAVNILAEGVNPGSTGREYIVRKLIRKCTAAAEMAGVDKPDFNPIISAVIKRMSPDNPLLAQKEKEIRLVFEKEAGQFQKVLKASKEALETELRDCESTKILSGSAALKLVTTRGLPYEILEQYTGERGFTIDKDAYLQAFEKHKEVSRAAGAGILGAAISAEEIEAAVKGIVPTEFNGYGTLQGDSPVQALIKQGQFTQEVKEGEEFAFIVGSTPFYAESGGQVGDQGTAHNPRCTIEISYTSKVGGYTLHKAKVTRGVLHTGEELLLQVNSEARAGTRRNHSATHLLHNALISVIAKGHLEQGGIQKGSLVEPKRLRFDFQRSSPLTQKEKETIEAVVNRQISQNIPVTTTISSPDEAVKQGAMALFGEKYGDKVRVVKMGNESVELCGGTHVASTGEIGAFLIVSESSIAKGIRRIEAVTGPEAIAYAQTMRNRLSEISKMLSASEESAVEALRKLQSDKDKKAGAAGKLQEIESTANLSLKDGHKLKLVEVSHEKPDTEALLAQHKGANAVVVIINKHSGKVSVSVASFDPKFDAGAIVKRLISPFGGKGGGHNKQAQGGFAGVERAPELIEKLRQDVSEF